VFPADREFKVEFEITKAIRAGAWQCGCVQKSRFLHKTQAPEILPLSLCRIYVQNHGMIYGYARVSTDGQSVAAQVAALTGAGAEKVYREVASGAKTDRAQLRRLLDRLDAGDVLTVTRLDRLARSTRDLLNTLAAITGKGAGFRSLGDTWADTTTPHGRLMLTVLGGLAEFERELIRVRTGEGRDRAKARGVKLGRKPKLTPHQQHEAIERRERGNETLAEIGRSYNVSGWTISRLTA
jgi:DNA invertase Pin-like site-specific DNA recombinase